MVYVFSYDIWMSKVVFDLLVFHSIYFDFISNHGYVSLSFYEIQNLMKNDAWRFLFYVSHSLNTLQELQ